MTENVLTNEQALTIIVTWRKLQGSPDLLEGLTFGEFEDFALALMSLMIATNLNRLVPLGLVKRLANPENMLAMIEDVRELCGLEVVRDALDVMAAQR